MRAIRSLARERGESLGSVISSLVREALRGLAWPNHIHHARALHWFRAVREQGWATCTVTEFDRCRRT